MRNRSVSSSSRLREIKKKKLLNLRNNFFACFLGVTVLLGGLAYFSRLPKVNIQNIEIVGNKVIDKEPVENLVKDILKDKYLWLFPKTNIMIYPREEIENNINHYFSRAKDINFNLKELNTLEISFNEREPESLWCGEILPEGELSSDMKCYFMDNVGYIFDEAPFFSGEVYFRFFGGIANVENPKGSIFMEDSFQKLISFKDSLLKLNLKPSVLYVKNDRDIEIILTSSLPLKEAPRIIFESSSDLVKMAENLQSALAVDPLKRDINEKYKELKYIDLRFGNKVYYKF